MFGFPTIYFPQNQCSGILLFNNLAFYVLSYVIVYFPKIGLPYQISVPGFYLHNFMCSRIFVSDYNNK